MRTFTMIFAICGLIILILLTSILTLKLLKRKRNELIFNNFSPQLDPLLANVVVGTSGSSTVGSSSITAGHNDPTLPEYTVRAAAIQTPLATRLVDASSLSSSMNQFYLPTYQEAIQQPIQQQAIQAMAAATTTSTQVASISHDPKLDQQINSQAPINAGCTRSRSGSVRSTGTSRSANGSIRTANSTATTNSVGTASFHIPLASSSSASSSSRSKPTAGGSTSIRSKQIGRTAVNQLNLIRRQASKTNRSTNSSAISETNGSGGGNMSLMSNETNASIKGIRGSSSGLDLVSAAAANGESNTDSPAKNPEDVSANQH